MLGWQEVVLIFAILLLVFGPTKLPKIARELGKAMQAFNKATSGAMEEINKATSGAKEEFNKASSSLMEDVRPSSTGASRPPLKAADTWKRDKALSDIAKKLNITTAGKTNEQIAQEINERIDSREKASNTTAAKR